MADEQSNNLSGDSSGNGAPTPRTAGPLPARVLDYGRTPGRRVLEWVRRDEVRNFIKSMAWVAPLTILIWVYAEREKITQTAPWPIPVAVKTTDPKKHVSLTSSDSNIMARLEGSKAAVDQVRQILTTGTPHRLEIYVPSAMLAGRSGSVVNVPTAWVGNNPLFSSRGVTVFECSPVALQVEVDDIVDEPLTVAPLPGTAAFDGPPTFTPATVTFHGPSKLLENKAFFRDRDGKLIIYADFSDKSRYKIDGPFTTAVLPLKMPANTVNDPYTLSAMNVEAKFTQKAQDEKGTIDSMPIFVQGPPAKLDANKVTLEGDAARGRVANVEVSGPPAVIRKLNTGELVPVPKAILDILPDDKTVESLSRAPRFELPPDLKITADSAQITIQFKLEPR